MNKTGYLIIVGILAAALLLSIIFLAVLVNHRPIVTGLEADPQLVVPRGTCQIVCNATDPDGDDMIYGWSVDEGTIAMTESADTMTWTAPGSKGSYNVTVIVTDGHGGATTEYTTVTVRNNRAPTISSLTADADWTLPSGSIQVACDASDPDKDELSYEWAADGGDVSGTGTVVSWIAPQEVGVYNVTVTINDGYGLEATRFVSLSTAMSDPPPLEELSITAKEPKYLKTIVNGYLVGKEKEYDIECTVSDTGGSVFYTWSSDGGQISGDGSIITWTAPNASLWITVTIVVSDTAGNNRARNIYLDVVSCSTCTFG
ncbi:MAG: hypothetical protein A2Z77_06875 [Chloroflexi bacterium RBG_13_51_36]|nr:MAG: hypothetical protein A2Z77_06875 [Chloroflexi bacterium RBG_13_51_36]